MNAPLSEVLAAYRARLEAIYGSRLKQLILFGSRARGDAREDSDIDVLIVLKAPVDRWVENQRTSEASSDVSIEFGVDIARAFATGEDYLACRKDFLRNVMREGLSIHPTTTTAA